MKSIVTLLLTLFFIASSGYSQNVELGTKDKKVVVKDGENKQNVRRTVIDYENFELTKDNLSWAKDQVQREKIRAEKEMKTGVITQEQYETRMRKIAEAEARIKEFERSPENIDALSEEEKENGVKYDPRDAEMVNKKDAYEKRLKEREERQKMQREANRSKNLEKSYTTMLANIEREKQMLESDYKAGKVSKSEYDNKMARFAQTERQLKSKIEEIQKQKDSDNNVIKHGREESGNKNKEASNKNTEALERIEKDKAYLAKALETGQITQKEYDEKMARIKQVEKAIIDMQ